MPFNLCKPPRTIRNQWPATISGSPEGTHVISPVRDPSKDCLGLLPLEIRIEIAAYLPTADFLALRCSSRAMTFVFHVPSFWATRFLIDGDRGFLSYLQHTESNLDWRQIYRHTAHLNNLSYHLRTRHKLWLKNRWIKDRYSMSNFNITPIQKDQILRKGLYGIFPQFESAVPREGSRYRWQEACGEWSCDQAPYGRNHYRPNFEIMKHFERTQNISIHSPLKILVSVLDEGKDTFIAGFEMVYSHEPNEVFGYSLPRKQIEIDLQQRRLRALDVCAGKGCIQALRPCFSTQTDPNINWIGVSDGAECTKTRLELNGRIRMMQGKFDVSFPYTNSSVFQADHLMFTVLSNGKVKNRVV